MTEEEALKLLKDRTWEKVQADIRDGNPNGDHWLDYLFLHRVASGLER